MSKVNRFMSPVQDTNKQTYVSQYVPMPFEVMRKKAESEQKRNDAVKTNWQTLQEKMGEKLLDADSQMMNDKLTVIQDRVNNAIKEANGDYRGLNDVITGAASEYNKDIKSGELSFAITQREKAKSNNKILDAEKNMPGDIKALMKKRLLSDYSAKNEEGVGGYRAGNQMGEAIVYDPEGLQKELQGYISALNISKDKDAIDPLVSFNEGKLLITGFDETNELTKDRIQRLSGVMYESPKFNAMVNGEYFALNPNMTKEEFKKQRFAQLFSGFNAMAYKEEAEEKKATIIKKDKIKNQSDIDFSTDGQIEVGSTIAVKYEPNPEFLDEDNKIVDNPLEVIKSNNLKSGSNLVAGSLQDLYFETHDNNNLSDNENKNNFNGDFKSLLKEKGIPIDIDKQGVEKISPQTYNSFFKYISTADEEKVVKEISGLFNNQKPKIKSFLKKAKQEYKAVLNRNQFLKEAEDQLRKEGSLKGNLYYKGEDGTKNEITAEEFEKEQLSLKEDEKIYLSAINTYIQSKGHYSEDKGDRESLTSHLFDNSYTFIQAGGVNSKARQVLNYLDYMDKFVKEGGTYETFWDKAAKQPGDMDKSYLINLAKRRKAVVDKRRSIQLKKDGDYYQNKLNAVMKARLVGGGVEIPTSNRLNIEVYNDKTKEWSNQILTKEKAIETIGSLDNYTDIPLLDSKGKEIKISDLEKRYQNQKEKDEFKKRLLSTLEFTKTADPVTNSMEFVFADNLAKEKYRMKINIGDKKKGGALGFGGSNIRLSNKKRAEMKLMGDVYNAKLSNLQSSVIGEPSLGVSIFTKGEGTVDKGLSFDEQFATGGTYEVRINPMKLGLYIKDGEGNFMDNLAFPTENNNAANILRTYQNILDGNHTLKEKNPKRFEGKSDVEIAKIYLKTRIRENITEGSEEDGAKEKAQMDQESNELKIANDEKAAQQKIERQKYLKSQEQNKTPYQIKKELEANVTVPNSQAEIDEDLEILKKNQVREKAKARVKAKRALKVLETKNSTGAEKVNAVDEALKSTVDLNEKHKLIDKVLVGERMNPLTFAYEYLGVKETDPAQQDAIKGFLENAVGYKVDKGGKTTKELRRPIGDKSKVTLNVNAWCAAFVDHILRENNFGVLNNKDKFDNIRAFKYDNNAIGKKITKKEDYSPGDIMILDTGKTGHVGFYAGMVDGQMMMLGGNQQDQINVMPVPASFKIVSVRRVKNFKEIDKEKLTKILSKDSLDVYKDQVKANKKRKSKKPKTR